MRSLIAPSARSSIDFAPELGSDLLHLLHPLADRDAAPPGDGADLLEQIGQIPRQAARRRVVPDEDGRYRDGGPRARELELVIAQGNDERERE